MSDNYAASVLYKADIERELHNRAAGMDAEDYILVDSLCAELNKCLGADCRSFRICGIRLSKTMPVSLSLVIIFLSLQI